MIEVRSEREAPREVAHKSWLPTPNMAQDKGSFLTLIPGRHRERDVKWTNGTSIQEMCLVMDQHPGDIA